MAALFSLPAWKMLGFLWFCVYEGINNNAHIYDCSSSACSLSCPGKVQVTQSGGDAAAPSSCCMLERRTLVRPAAQCVIYITALFKHSRLTVLLHSQREHHVYSVCG